MTTPLYDTSIAKQWDQEVHALALTEHWGHDIGPTCLGLCPHGDNDGGRAFGLLQQHGCFVQQFYRSSGGAALTPFLASVDDTWSEVQIKAAATFLTLYDTMAIELAIQAYNQGVEAVLNGVRAPVYLDRWQQSLARIKSGAA